MRKRRNRRMTPEQRASQARMEAQQRASQAALEANCCPQCGSQVRRNLAITGWVQCEQYGSVGFRARDEDPQCSWQGFTQ